MEGRKPKEELDKTVIEAADISFDMLKDIIKTQESHVKFLEDRLKFKQEELDKIRKENEALIAENIALKEK